jgi:hypothetical protein
MQSYPKYLLGAALFVNLAGLVDGCSANFVLSSGAQRLHRRHGVWQTPRQTVFVQALRHSHCGESAHG